MQNKKLIDTLKKLKEKENYTLYELSRKLDIQVSTLERWLKKLTGLIGYTLNM